MTATFIPDATAEADFVQQSSARFRQIADYQATQQTAMRVARIVQHYRKFPWTNPGLAVAFAKWKDVYGAHAAKGLSRAAFDATQAGDDPKDAVESYAMTKEFQRQVKDYQGDISLADFVALPKRARDQLAPNVLQNFVGRPLIPEAPWATLGKELSGQGTPGVLGNVKVGDVDVGQVAKGVTRAGFTALETPFQELQALQSGYATGGLPNVDPLNTGIQQAQRSFLREGGAQLGAYQPGSSSGFIAAEHAAQGQPVDLGTGYFPGGQVEEEHRQRLKDIASLSYGGEQHFLTPGRTLAYAANNAFDILEPGTMPYNVVSGAVDAANLIVTDPANIGLIKLGDINRARKGFDLAAETEKAGGFASAWRSFTHGPTVQKWLDSPKGNAFTRWVSGLNPEQDFLPFQRATGWKIPAKQSVALIKQDTPEAVREVFEPLAGVAVREQPAPWSVGSQVRQTAGTRRIFNTRSTDVIDLNNLDGPSGGLNQLYNWMKNAKIPEDQISPVLHNLAQAKTGFGSYEAIDNAMTAGRLALEARGVPHGAAIDATRVFKDDLGEGSRYYIQQITDGAPVPGAVIDGTVLPETSPHLWVEALNPKVYLPSSHDIDATLAKHGRVLGIPGTGATDIAERVLEGGRAGSLPLSTKYGAWATDSFLTHMQSKIWVPLQLLRGAWTLRVIGEEQIRMAASGLSNAFSHPLAHIGWVTGRDGALTNETLHEAMDARGALTREAGGFFSDVGAQRVVAKGKKVLTPEDGRDHAVGWADELIKLNADPVANRVANVVHDNRDLGDLKDAFFDGGLSHFREGMKENERLAPILETRSGSDAYIDSVYNRIHDMSAGDSDLIRFVAKGLYGDATAGDLSIVGRKVIDEGYDPTLEGLVVSHQAGHTHAQVLFPGADQPMYTPVSDLKLLDDSPNVARTMAHDGVRVDKEFVSYLNARPVKPERVVGDIRKLEPVHQGWLDRQVRNLFSTLMAKPSNYLSRSPTFKQRYWERVQELMPLADSQTQHLAVSVATDEKLPGAILSTLRGARDSAKVGELSYQEIDDLAKGHALDSVKDLLYDLNRRSQFFEATRLLFPFGEAWKEILTRWAKIPFEHPDVARKFQVAVGALRDTKPASILPGAVAEPYKNQGFFFTDPTTGQETFAYPWSHQLTDALVGLPVPFTSPVSGLSLAFNVMPGVGPVAQVGANAFMDRFLADPKYDPIRNVIFPYGEPDYAHGIAESFAPAWLQKWLTAGGISKEDSRQLNNTVMQVLAYGASTGDYDLNSKDGVRQAVNDAYDKARTLYMVRGTFQWGAPSAPNPRFLIESKKGTVLNTTLRDEFYRMSQKDPDHAVAKFLNRYGEKAFYSTQSFTLSGSYALPFTKEQVAWQRTNQGLTDKYPTTYGFFAPPGDPKDFDYDAYLRSIARGERTPLDPKDWAKHANDSLGWYWYDYAREQMGLKAGDTADHKQSVFLADLRDKIREQYPGWNDVESTPNKVAHAVEELQAAAKDKGLRKSNPGLTEALRYYFEARAGAVGIVRQRGGTSEFGRPGYGSGQKYADVRGFLHTVGDAIAKEYPAFRNVWETVLSRDVGTED